MKPPHRETTSDKQRRHDIKARRQQLRRERADQVAKEYEAGLVSRVAAGRPIDRSAWCDQELITLYLRSGRPIPGVELADQEVLVRDRGLQTEIPVIYQDWPFSCRDCGAEAVWTAADQKWWHETAHGAFGSHPILCLRLSRQATEATRSKRRLPVAGGNPAPSASWLEATQP